MRASRFQLDDIADLECHHFLLCNRRRGRRGGRIMPLSDANGPQPWPLVRKLRAGATLPRARLGALCGRLMRTGHKLDTAIPEIR